MARWLLRVAVAASLLLIAAHFAYTASTFHALTLESVQFAELGLPLLFAAFLNGVVWSLDDPPARARVTAHVTNACMLIVAVLVARLSPIPPAFLIVLCTVLLVVAAVASDRSRARAPGAVGAPVM